MFDAQSRVTRESTFCSRELLSPPMSILVFVLVAVLVFVAERRGTNHLGNTVRSDGYDSTTPVRPTALKPAGCTLRSVL